MKGRLGKENRSLDARLTSRDADFSSFLPKKMTPKKEEEE